MDITLGYIGKLVDDLLVYEGAELHCLVIVAAVASGDSRCHVYLLVQQ